MRRHVRDGDDDLIRAVPLLADHAAEVFVPHAAHAIVLLGAGGGGAALRARGEAAVAVGVVG